MVVGVVSDSHDHMPKLRAAVDALRARDAQHLLHAGDWVALFAVKVFVECGIPFTGILGNNDGERDGIGRLTPHVHPSPHALEMGGRRIVLAHDLGKLPEKAREGADVVVFGHTHQVAVEPGPPLLLNPGECCGWVTGKCTVALLDLETLAVSILEV